MLSLEDLGLTFKATLDYVRAKFDAEDSASAAAMARDDWSMEAMWWYGRPRIPDKETPMLIPTKVAAHKTTHISSEESMPSCRKRHMNGWIMRVF